jgi:DNA-binding NarL/FixJ family response regulator
MSARARLLIIEDHPLVAEGLRALLEPHYEVVDIVHESRHAVAAVKRVKPALVLLDLSMPECNGLELLPLLRRANQSLKVLVVTMHMDRAMADMAFEAGADGFVPKESTAVELRDAIGAVLRGERYLSPRVPKRAYRGADAIGNPSLDRLTPRQQQILRMVGEGKSGPEIAASLGVSPRTIEYHRASIRRALGIATETGLVRYAVMVGLVAGGSVALADDEREE